MSRRQVSKNCFGRHVSGRHMSGRPVSKNNWGVRCPKMSGASSVQASRVQASGVQKANWASSVSASGV